MEKSHPSLSYCCTTSFWELRTPTLNHTVLAGVSHIISHWAHFSPFVVMDRTWVVAGDWHHQHLLDGEASEQVSAAAWPHLQSSGKRQNQWVCARLQCWTLSHHQGGQKLPLLGVGISKAGCSLPPAASTWPHTPGAFLAGLFKARRETWPEQRDEAGHQLIWKP